MEDVALITSSSTHSVAPLPRPLFLKPYAAPRSKTKAHDIVSCLENTLLCARAAGTVQTSAASIARYGPSDPSGRLVRAPAPREQPRPPASDPLRSSTKFLSPEPRNPLPSSSGPILSCRLLRACGCERGQKLGASAGLCCENGDDVDH